MANLTKTLIIRICGLTGMLIIPQLTGCVSPKNQGLDFHSDMMYTCRAMCGEGLVQSYEPFNGQCKCRKGNK